MTGPLRAFLDAGHNLGGAPFTSRRVARASRVCVGPPAVPDTF